MIKKILILIIVVILFDKNAYSHEDENALMFFINSPIGVQQGFGSKNPNNSLSFDTNITLVIFNLGYNYQDYSGHNGYIGLGIGSAIQVQYGYGFTQKKNLLRIRTDLPLYSFTENKQSPLSFCSLGLYCEKTFDNQDKGLTVGVSVGFNISTLLFLESNSNNRKGK
ncbi:hypothetical protein [uncultured Acetobacteroides sp.]|uniref:hypothetical protein n=1 Tax=uncultured Acetobacteroides sp. TaxID=1760811 RepID=UPI0029F5542B|nr:hypothetical protein [uncultured Acetobacteroides sp.]